MAIADGLISNEIQSGRKIRQNINNFDLPNPLGRKEVVNRPKSDAQHDWNTHSDIFEDLSR